PEEARALWCRPSGSDAFAFELLINDADADTWYFKRDRSISLPIEKFGWTGSQGIPFLAPEVVLLHKGTSAAFDAEDTEDFRVAVDQMTVEQRRWLRRSLARFEPDHSWMLTLAIE
ncbi:MAG: hypothetical protein ACRD1T_11725, partial [Acidimicrobiia bacterium]